MPRLECDVSQSLWNALEERRRKTGESLGHIVREALADALQLDHATLFQVSTSGALVEGVYQGAVSVGHLLEHGDFGLGTFEDLDGEMIVVDGRCYQARGDGSLREAPEDARVPFAVVTHFRPEASAQIDRIASFGELTARLDELRNTENLFFSVSARARFDYLKIRTVCRASANETLVEATGHQQEFEFEDAQGRLVGFWTPEYARTVNIPGYHLHYLADDLESGGHLLECRARQLEVEIEHASDFRMAIPETSAFLRADLTRDPSDDLEKAEG